jgi:hypothetical protein
MILDGHLDVLKPKKGEEYLHSQLTDADKRVRKMEEIIADLKQMDRELVETGASSMANVIFDKVNRLDEESPTIKKDEQ